MNKPERPAPSPPPPELMDRFAAIVGEAYAIRDAQAMQPYLVELRDRYRGKAALVLRPGSTAEVSNILALANATRTPIVPQGGNTGLVGGQVPYEGGNEIVVSLSRLNRIRDVDPRGNAMTVEAGVVLANAQAAAAAADRLFPLSLGAEGSCQVGGNLSTNAGGTGVLAYGNARALVLGLEVVLADGRVWDGLRSLRKDNTGYDLKDLFIGSEGTLGLITAAVLKLFPKPKEYATVVAGLTGVDRIAQLFELAAQAGDRSLTAFEIVPRMGIDFVLRHGAQVRDPMSETHAWYALMELSGHGAAGEAAATMQGILERALERRIIEDAAIAASLQQRDEFWRLREQLAEVQHHEGGSIKHDVSVPIAAIPKFIAEADRIVERMIPGARPLAFGHYGDGNIHYNVSQPVGADKAAFLSRWEALNEAVHGLVAGLGGTISAEHGIGRMKREMLPRFKSEVEMDLMRRLKAALDPNGILNPGKVL